MRTPQEVFLELVHGVAEGRVDDLPALYAEETNVVHPFDPFRSPPLRTREALREHFTARPSTALAFARRPVDITIHETVDPEVIVAEFAYRGTVVETGAPFELPCIFVLRVRDGEIVESRDYVDHLAGARARGRLAELFAAMA